MENVLLHSCCAPCSAAIVEWMLAQDIRPTFHRSETVYQHLAIVEPEQPPDASPDRLS